MILILAFLLLVLPPLSWAQPTLPLSRTAIDWTEPLARGLVGWWLAIPERLGGTRWEDLTGRKVGTLTNMAVPATGSSGWGRTTSLPNQLGELRSDGTDDIVITTAYTDPRYTYALWMRSTSIPTTGPINQPINNNTTTTDTSVDTWGFSWNHGSATFTQAAFHRAAGGTYTAAKLTTALQAHTWYRLAITYDGINLRAYLNGRLEATTASAVPSYTGTELHIAGGGGGTTYFQGFLNDIRIYGRALTSKEVVDDYFDSRQPVKRLWAKHSVLPTVLAALAAPRRRQPLIFD